MTAIVREARAGDADALSGVLVRALLLDAAERRAVDLGFTRVRLNVRLILDTLRAYYQAHGYAPVAYLTHEGYLGPTYVQMEKVLRAS